MKTRDIETDDWRAPTVAAGETVLFDEPGRVLDRKAEGGHTDVCYRAYWFRVVSGQFGPVALRVKHGGGEESWNIGYATDPAVEALGMLDSDARYFVLHALMDAHHTSASNAADRTSAHWRQAAADKRIKTRKLPRQNAVKVWIEDAREVHA